MKQNKVQIRKICGWILFLLSIGCFCMQIGYMFVHSRFQVEYSDNRIFYVVNIFCALCLGMAIYFLLKLAKKTKLIGIGILVLFMIVNVGLLFYSNHQIKNIVSLSPDLKHVFSIKENTNTGEAIFYQTYFGILARPKERLPYATTQEFKVEWLAKDVAAVTYKAKDHSIHQYIGTFGNRGGEGYYYVGPSIYGHWKGNDIEVISNKEGISVFSNGKKETFDWDHIVQFGTLAVVLTANDQAVWTISLNENFEVQSAADVPPTGEISLYKATMEKTEPIILYYESSNL
ncbi:hypothetical protein QNH20_12140 [Neobacillus sp. WH10]|uniref:hypothetical protein n=1 Tax=Neobacillus sp. WH10 TaxID=3047873 RepID=UPI0024C1462F|nr:hypothetical protein [Neobacillus sp. WH10]WHY79843.1 hypothetical protein QNH20_12140 [Neobacillus sp. WH10]